VAPAVALAAALLAFAALARSLVGPAWAVAATAALAVTQPVLHAGRSTYSEPLALLVGCAALCLLVVAGRLEDGTGKNVHGRVRTAWLGLVAGLLLGGAGLVRVDALREAALLVPVAALLIWRGSAVGRPLLAGLGAGVLYAAGAALLLSRPYLGAIAGSLLPLVALVLVLAGGSWLALRLGAVARRTPALAGGCCCDGLHGCWRRRCSSGSSPWRADLCGWWCGRARLTLVRGWWPGFSRRRGCLSTAVAPTARHRSAGRRGGSGSLCWCWLSWPQRGWRTGWAAY
jgi:hypothetical protein